MRKHVFLDPRWNLQTRISALSSFFTGSRHAIKLKPTLGSLIDQRSWFMTSSAIFVDVSKNDFWSIKCTWVTWHDWWRHQSTSSSRAIPGVSFNFIAYVEPETPGSPPPPHQKKKKKNLACIKTQNSWKVNVHEKSCTKLCHSLTLTLTLTRFKKMSKIILFIHIKSICSFFLDAWLFLSPLLQYVETHSTIGIARTLHKWSTIWFASSND